MLSATTVTISGKKKVGKKVRAVVKRAKPGPVKVTYRWYVGRKKIARATKPSLTLTRAWRGKKIKVKVTTRKAGYRTVTVTSRAVRVAK